MGECWRSMRARSSARPLENSRLSVAQVRNWRAGRACAPGRGPGVSLTGRFRRRRQKIARSAPVLAVGPGQRRIDLESCSSTRGAGMAARIKRTAPHFAWSAGHGCGFEGDGGAPDFSGHLFAPSASLARSRKAPGLAVSPVRGEGGRGRVCGRPEHPQRGRAGCTRIVSGGAARPVFQEARPRCEHLRRAETILRTTIRIGAPVAGSARASASPTPRPRRRIRGVFCRRWTRPCCSSDFSSSPRGPVVFVGPSLEPVPGDPRDWKEY